MSNRQIKVTFRTLTPLWTGDAWGDNKEIRPSSIIGSLRFWFEVICYFAGVTSNKNYDDKGKLNDNLDEKSFKEKVLNNGLDFARIDKALAECKISLPSRVLGCTGWKGWVRIKKVEFKKDNFKEDLKGRIIKNKNWFWGSPYYEGKFKITFELEDKILEPIFYPLLTFIERYGFLGGKWNIGYGRVKIESIDDDLWNEFKNKNDNEIDFENFKKLHELIVIENNFSASTQSYEFLKYFFNVNSFYCFNERDFQKKVSNIPRNIRIVKLNDNFSDFKNAIQELLKIKAKMRYCLRPNNSIVDKEDWNNFRHRLLGTTSNGLEGTKIIPWIYEENNQLKGGFVSIAGIIGLGGNYEV